MTQKELLRLEEIETKARDKFLAYSDYETSDWLDTTKEKREYKKLFAKFLAKF